MTLMKTYSDHLKTTFFNIKNKLYLNKPIFRSSAIFPYLINKDIKINSN